MFKVLLSSTIFWYLFQTSSAHLHAGRQHHVTSENVHFALIQEPRQTEVDPISMSIREHWMRRARSALLELTGSPCPFGAFGTAIINHTGQPNGSLGTLICIGANQIQSVGNPTLHGEIAAINNCTTVLASPPFNLNATEILSAFKDLSLYTTAESCPMCAAAISWASFHEYIYATSIWTLIDMGWSQIRLGSRELLRRSPVAGQIRIVSGVLEQETDELFGWQFSGAKCPTGCVRGNSQGAQCMAKI